MSPPAAVHEPGMSEGWELVALAVLLADLSGTSAAARTRPLGVGDGVANEDVDR